MVTAVEIHFGVGTFHVITFKTYIKLVNQIYNNTFHNKSFIN